MFGKDAILYASSCQGGWSDVSINLWHAFSQLVWEFGKIWLLLLASRYYPGKVKSWGVFFSLNRDLLCSAPPDCSLVLPHLFRSTRFRSALVHIALHFTVYTGPVHGMLLWTCDQHASLFFLTCLSFCQIYCMCSLSCPGSLTSSSIPATSDGRSKHGVSLKLLLSIPSELCSC